MKLVKVASISGRVYEVALNDSDNVNTAFKTAGIVVSPSVESCIINNREVEITYCPKNNDVIMLRKKNSRIKVKIGRVGSPLREVEVRESSRIVDILSSLGDRINLDNEVLYLHTKNDVGNLVPRSFCVSNNDQIVIEENVKMRKILNCLNSFISNDATLYGCANRIDKILRNR